MEILDLVEIEALDQEKCTKLNALIVEKTAKSLSNQWKANQFIAETATKTTRSFNLIKTFYCQELPTKVGSVFTHSY